MSVHGGRRRKPNGRSDLADGRRVAVPLAVVEDEAPDLALPCSQFRAGLHLTLRGPRTGTNKCSPVAYGLLRTASNEMKEPPEGGPEGVRWRGLEPPRPQWPLGPQPSA